MATITTQRLRIASLTQDEITQLIDRYRDAVPELSAAYHEMLDNCVRYPEQYVWYAPWKISLSGGGEIGFAGFKGFNGGRPEIGYGINEEHQGNGYASEAVRALCAWAKKVPGVVAIEAEVEFDNAKSINVLTKSGFVSTGTRGAEGPRYVCIMNK